MAQWKKPHKGISSLFLVFAISMSGCATSEMDFNRKYREEWKKVIKSQAWNNAIEHSNDLASLDTDNVYMETSKTSIVNLDYKTIMDTDAVFNEKYHSLVSRSYFKIITEAQKADERLKREYERLNLEKKDSINKNNIDFKNQLKLINKQYSAHIEMLEGLKGWNIFSEKRTGDLEFFKNENVNTVYRKYKNGETDDAIIAFLIYQLADLYHFEN